MCKRTPQRGEDRGASGNGKASASQGRELVDQWLEMMLEMNLTHGPVLKLTPTEPPPVASKNDSTDAWRCPDATWG